MAPGVDDWQAKLAPPAPVPPVTPPVVVPEPMPPVVPVEPVPPEFRPPMPMSFEMIPVQAESPRTNVEVAKMDQAPGRLLSLKNFEVAAIPSVFKWVILVC